MSNPEDTSEAARATEQPQGASSTSGSAIPAGPAIQERDLREHAPEGGASEAGAFQGSGREQEPHQRPQEPDASFADGREERGSEFEYGDGLEPEREPEPEAEPESEPDLERGRTDRADRSEPDDDLAAPHQTTTGAVNRDLAAQRTEPQPQSPQDARATSLSTAEPAASMDLLGADQDSMAGDAVRTRPRTTPMRPAPAPATDPDAILERETTRQFRERWRAIQAEFVDDPRHAVEDADRLLTDVTRAFNSGLEERRRALSAGQQRDGHGETEELRLAIRRYRALVDAMLHD